ncbi:MAG: dTDP-4-dehydrorhamnose reductase [Candidatus Saccharimonadaceae bacterium]
MAIYSGSNKNLGGTEETKTKEQFYYGLVQKKVLVTGATGQLGSELKDFDNQHESMFQYFYTGSTDLDITQLDAVRSYVEQHSINYIINCAAYTMVDLCESDEELCNEVNYLGVENLAKVSAEFNCKLIHVSTDYVFDGLANKPYREDSPVNPLSVYGKAKLRAEEAVMSIAPNSIIIRTAWLYSSYKVNFVKTMLRLMSERNELAIVSDQHGTPTYSRDLAEAFTLILDNAEAGDWNKGIYHFSNLGETTWYGFAEKIKQLSNIEGCQLKPIDTKDYPTPAVRPLYTVLDKTKIQDTFHFTIPHWEESLEKFFIKLRLDK